VSVAADVGALSGGWDGPWCRDRTVRDGGRAFRLGEDEEDRGPGFRRGWSARKATNG